MPFESKIMGLGCSIGYVYIFNTSTIVSSSMTKFGLMASPKEHRTLPKYHVILRRLTQFVDNIYTRKDSW